jgi:deoxyribonuclease-1-like protein
MKIIFSLYFVLNFFHISGQELNIVSWNLRDFGKSRSDMEMQNIAKIIQKADIVAIQEVVAKDPGGAKAVARLADELNRMGSKWDYVVSDPTKSTSSHKSERYAYLWKTSKVKILSKARLLSEITAYVEREPFVIQFSHNGKSLTLVNYHACTHKADFPERKEISAITSWLLKQNHDNIIWLGDMNLEIDDSAFSMILKNKYKNVLNGQKTTLKKSCVNGEYLSSAEDNILHKLSQFTYNGKYILDFVGEANCESVADKSVSYSDHLAVGIIIE